MSNIMILYMGRLVIALLAGMNCYLFLESGSALSGAATLFITLMFFSMDASK